MTDNLSEGIRLLGAYTAGRFDIWALAGSYKAGCRAHVMSGLMGRRVPQSKAGVTALQSAFYAQIKPAGDCSAARDDAFVEFCRAHSTATRTGV